MEKKDLKSMDLNEVTAFVTELGEKPFRAKQLYQWMHQKLAPSLEDMTNLPKACFILKITISYNFCNC